MQKNTSPVKLKVKTPSQIDSRRVEVLPKGTEKQAKRPDYVMAPLILALQTVGLFLP
jgi:hypothetical protein